MKRDDRKPGREEVAQGHPQRRATQPAPGKVTRTSKLPAGREESVQRQVRTGSTGAASPEVKSLWDHTLDPWMDAAHRGTPLPSDRREAAVQAKGAIDASGPEGVPGRLPGNASAASGVQRKSSGVVQRDDEEDAEEHDSDPVAAVRQALDEGSEERAITLMMGLDAGQANAVLARCKALAVDCFGNETMGRACAVLVSRGGNLARALGWMFEEGTNWELLRATIRACADQGQIAALRTNTWRDRFVGEVGNVEMAAVVEIIGGDLALKLDWMRAEGTSWDLVRPKLASASEAEKAPIRSSDDWMSFFVDICDDTEMATAVRLLGGDTAFKRKWLDAEGTSLGEYADELVGAEVNESGSVSHTPARDADRHVQEQLAAYVGDAVADGRQITGMVAVVGDADWDIVGINHYGEATWNGGKRDRINGFVDGSGRVFIHRDRGNAGTMIHEAVHKYSDDAVLNLSQPLNEGITEYFTRSVCNGAGIDISGRGNYQGNYDCVSQFVALVGEATVASAYFDGDTDGLRDAFIAQKSESDWDDFVTATQEKRWTDASALCGP